MAKQTARKTPRKTTSRPAAKKRAPAKAARPAAKKRAPAKATRPAAKKRAPAKATRAVRVKPTTTIDLVRLRPEFFRAARVPELVRLAPAKYLAVEGRGEPGGKAFSDAVQALYAVAYTMKFGRKFGGSTDFRVSTLECLWWFDDDVAPQDPTQPWSIDPRKWRWKLLVMVPDFVRKAEMEKAKRFCLERRPEARVASVVLETLREGSCVQMLHVGPYDNEPESIARMVVAAMNSGFRPEGRHHEIYLSDPRRTKPAQLRTILRQPVRRSPRRGAR